MEAERIFLRGAADLNGCPTPEDESGRDFAFALSWTIMMNPRIMAGIKNGISRAYAEEYARVNRLIDDLALDLTHKIKERGYQAHSSDRTDKMSIKGNFPYKTAATRGGPGWIGRSCQLVTLKMGPWVRYLPTWTFPAGRRSSAMIGITA